MAMDDKLSFNIKSRVVVFAFKADNIHKSYQTTIGIITQSLKSLGQF